MEAVFGRRVRRARESAGLTQAQLAERMRGFGATLDPSMVAKIEAGIRPTNIAEAVALRGALGIQSVAQLIETDMTDGEALALQLHRNWADVLARKDDLRRQWEQIRSDEQLLREREAALRNQGIDVVQYPETS